MSAGCDCNMGCSVWSVIVTWGVLSQGDYIWLEPETSGEFDVAVGAQVRSISGGSIHVVDDDKKVSQDGVFLKYWYLW